MSTQDDAGKALSDTKLLFDSLCARVHFDVAYDPFAGRRCSLLTFTDNLADDVESFSSCYNEFCVCICQWSQNRRARSLRESYRESYIWLSEYVANIATECMPTFLQQGGSSHYTNPYDWPYTSFEKPHKVMEFEFEPVLDLSHWGDRFGKSSRKQEDTPDLGEFFCFFFDSQDNLMLASHRYVVEFL